MNRQSINNLESQFEVIGFGMIFKEFEYIEWTDEDNTGANTW